MGGGAELEVVMWVRAVTVNGVDEMVRGEVYFYKKKKKRVGESCVLSMNQAKHFGGSGSQQRPSTGSSFHYDCCYDYFCY